MKEEKNTLKNHTKNLTEGSPVRLLLLFSLPLMAGNIFQQLYTIVDTAIVGKVLGVEALAYGSRQAGSPQRKGHEP